MPKKHVAEAKKGSANLSEGQSERYQVENHHNSHLLHGDHKERKGVWATLRYKLHRFVTKSCCTEDHVNNICWLQDNAHKVIGAPKPAMKEYLEFLSLSATGIIFIQLFPFWFGLGLPSATSFLCLVMMLAQIFTSYIKDTVCAKRPPSPPIVRAGGGSYSYEYGFPSGHTSGASLLYYVNSGVVLKHFGWPWYVAHGLGILYVAQVAFSRVYLGMHWAGDVLAGMGVTALILSLGHSGLFAIIDHLSSLRGLAGVEQWLVVALFCAVMVFHPQPKEKCPCLVDTARFTGAGLGAFLGYWLQSESVPLEVPTAGLSVYGYIVRTYAGMTMMVLSEVAVKLFLEKIFFRLPLLRRWGDAPFKTFWTNAYIWSRFWSHVAFAAVCFLGGQRIIPLLTF